MNPLVELFKQHIGKEMKQSPSASGRWLKGILLAVEEGSLEAEFTVRPEMTNPAHILHGGMTSLIADEMIGATVATLNLSVFFVSVSLNTEFFLPAKVGDKVKAEATIVRQGKTLINGECRIYNKEGKLMSRSSSNLIVTKQSAH